MIEDMEMHSRERQWIFAAMERERIMEMLLHKIKPTQILPIVMILLDLGAAAVCAWHKEYKKAVYWVSAAVLNATVTF